MKLLTITLLTSIVLLSSIAFGQSNENIEIRFAPDDHVFLAQDNRFIATTNVEIQNIAVVNPGDTTIQLEEIVIEIFSQKTLVTSNKYSGDLLGKSWQMLRGYVQRPGAMKQEDARFRFKELLGDQITLSETTTLKPKTAIFISRQFFFVQAIVEYVEGKPKATWPDHIRVSAKGATPTGEVVQGQNEIQIIYYQPKNKYLFPVRGRWYIAASSSVRSHHRLLPVHEFALDLIQIGAGGKSFQGEGETHSDYYAFGKEVYAMADGEVVEVYDGVRETRLRRKDESADDYRKAVLAPFGESERAYVSMGGNQIIIRHAGEEYSSYAHLKFGSILVKKGDRVKQGQEIAKVGITGDGYEPHLHFQLTDGPDVGYARGIPMLFENVKPVRFSSTIDSEGRRQLQTGEFIDTTD